MKTVQSTIGFAILALASLSSASASSTMNTVGKAVQASDQKRLGYQSRTENSGIQLLSEQGMARNIDSPDQPQTLGEAIAMQDSKRLGYQSRTSNSGSQLLSEGMARNVDSPNQPQTLGEAVAAQESKRLEVVSKTGGFAVEIVDREQDSRKGPKQTLGNRLYGSRGDSLLGMKDTNHKQSIELKTSFNESKIIAKGRGIDYVPVLETSFDRRAIENSGTQPSSGGVIQRGMTTVAAASVAATGLLFLQQIW